MHYETPNGMMGASFTVEKDGDQADQEEWLEKDQVDVHLPPPSDTYVRTI